jgi:hypothetical protein
MVRGVLTCSYCNSKNPDMGHAAKVHRKRASCHDKQLQGRVFFRKDKFVDHFDNVHPHLDAIKKALEARIQINSQFPQYRGFCDESQIQNWQSWQDRCDHIAAHFEEGKDMTIWRQSLSETSNGTNDDNDDGGDDHDQDDQGDELQEDEGNDGRPGCGSDGPHAGFSTHPSCDSGYGSRASGQSSSNNTSSSTGSKQTSSSTINPEASTRITVNLNGTRSNYQPVLVKTDQSSKLSPHENLIIAIKPIYHCTRDNCDYSSHQLSEWRRHEECETHWPQERFMCLYCPTPVSDTTGNPGCQFCKASFFQLAGSAQAHYLQCAPAKAEGKTFGRDNRLTEHLQKDHGECLQTYHDMSNAIPLALSWSYAVNSNWPRQCGFCGQRFQDWAQRMKHVGKHFQDGRHISSWTLPFPMKTLSVALRELAGSAKLEVAYDVLEEVLTAHSKMPDKEQPPTNSNQIPRDNDTAPTVINEVGANVPNSSQFIQKLRNVKKRKSRKLHSSVENGAGSPENMV